MKNILLTIVICGVFISCHNNCNTMICDCFDECEKPIDFLFSIDTINNGFKISEIDTVRIFKLIKGQNVLLDSVTILLDTNQRNYNIWSAKNQMAYSVGSCMSGYPVFMLDGNYLFDNNSNFENYDYEIYLGGIKKFDIKNIVIIGHGTTGKCCNCYVMDRKTLELNGISIDITNGGVGRKVVELKK